MERSLYEGHSTEAGLNFEDPGDFGAGEPNEAARSYRAGSADSSGPEPLFPFASPGPLPDPDPEAVRGAILRLARGAEPARDSVRELVREPVRDPVRDPVRSGATGDARGGFGAAEAGGSKPAADVKQRAVAGAEPIPSTQIPSFGEVARQLWGEGSAAPSAVRPGEREMEQAAGLQGAVAVTLEQAPLEQAPLEQAPVPSGLQSGLHSVIMSEPSASEPSAASLRASSQDDGRIFQPAAAAVPLKTPPRPVNGAGDRPALAHDACNLLSALALYSELLASPGVLGDEHRHYAEELKLMAGRSQVLIDRLLCYTSAGRAAGKDEILPTGEGLEPGVAVETEGPGRHASGGPLSSDLELEKLAHSGSGRGTAADSLSLTGVADQGTIEPGSRSADHVRSGASMEQVASADEFTALAPPSHSGSRSSASGGVEDARGTSLARLLTRWGSLLSTLAEGRLEVVFGAHAEAPVRVPAEALERILVNLVRNAKAATVQGGAIRIGVGVPEQELADGRCLAPPAGPEGTPGDSIAVSGSAAGVAPERSLGASQTMALTVDDSGCGMTEAQIRRVLGAGDADIHDLASISAGQRSARRQGLGLQIVRELVAASGGSLSIQSWPGRGTRVEIRWPVTILSTAEAPLAEVRVPDVRVPEATTAKAGAATFAPLQVPEPPPRSPGDAVLESAPRPTSQMPSLPAEVSSPAAEAVVPVAAATVVPAQPSVEEASFTGPVREDRSEEDRSGAYRSEAIGPDGFSEAELRAMMLRLHRTDPRERFPVGRSLRDWRPSEERRSGEIQIDTAGSDRGVEIPGSGLPALGGLGSGLLAPGVRAAEPGSLAGRAAKGAIAC